MKRWIPTVCAALLTTTSYSQDLAPNITFSAPDGSTVNGVRCATIETSPGTNDLQRLKEHAGLSAGTINIPVAFHVVTATNGTGDVPDDQLQEQIDTLNAGYDASGIVFFLSSIDRTANDSWFYNTMANDAVMKSNLAIDPTHNLNLYTANIGGGILGYSYLPWDFPESDYHHGVVVLYSSLPGGTAFPYNLGATATHEVGHYVGLYHTFENGCSSPGDYIDDTPYESSPAFGCPTGRNTCPSDPGVDPIHNYMDYSDDACMYEITQDQTDWLQGAITTYKPGLLSAAAVANPPSDLTAYSDYLTPSSIQLIWNDPTNLVTGDTLLVGYYHIFIKRDGVFLDSVAGEVEQYLDGGLNEGQTYTYELYARLDSSTLIGNSAIVSWVAGGSPIPGTPPLFTLSGNQEQVTIHWTNPAENEDGTPMIDYGGVRLYQDGALAQTYTRTTSDTALVDSAVYIPSPPGQHNWYLTAIDNELPPNESDPTSILVTPLSVPLLDAFSTAGLPDPSRWITTNADVNNRSNNPPSAPYALNLNGLPIGKDTVVMTPVDLSGMQSNGIVFAYQYQPQGDGNAPEVSDSLRLDFLNNLNSWIRIRTYAGRTLQPFVQETIDVTTAPNGGGSYFHPQFRVRFVNNGTAGPTPNDDWFIDNVYLGPPEPAIAASQDTVAFDTTLIGSTSTLPLDILNVGLEDLLVSAVLSTNPSIFSVDTTTFTIMSGESFTLNVSFSPNQPGAVSGMLLIASNDPATDTLRVNLTGMGDVPVGTRAQLEIPKVFSVSPNYPNPFNPSTTIRYQLPVASNAELVIYNLLGSKVRTLLTGKKEAGSYEVEWDGTNDVGVPVTSGVYVYRFTAGSYQMVRKMILVK